MAPVGVLVGGTVVAGAAVVLDGCGRGVVDEGAAVVLTEEVELAGGGRPLGREVLPQAAASISTAIKITKARYRRRDRTGS